MNKALVCVGFIHLRQMDAAFRDVLINDNGVAEVQSGHVCAWGRGGSLQRKVPEEVPCMPDAFASSCEVHHRLTGAKDHTMHILFGNDRLRCGRKRSNDSLCTITSAKVFKDR